MLQHIHRMPCNRLPWKRQNYRLKGRRNQGKTSRCVRPERANKWPKFMLAWWWWWWWCILLHAFIKSGSLPQLAFRYWLYGRRHSERPKRQWKYKHDTEIHRQKPCRSNSVQRWWRLWLGLCYIKKIGNIHKTQHWGAFVQPFLP